MRGAETVHVKRPGELDWQGDPVGPPAEFDVTNCQLWPRTSTEDSDSGRVIIDGWNLYVPPRSPNTIFATDTVTVRGEEFNVVGVPGRYDLKGRDKGMIVVLERVGA